jgi:hypothetical protein
MFGKYALPHDDRAGLATSITASDPDAEYPAENLVATDTTGHLNLPSRPAKLDATSGYFELAYGTPIDIVGAAIINHNFDEDLDVTLIIDGGTPIPFTIEAHHADGWPQHQWIEFEAQSASTVRLSINDANSIPVQVGRLLLLAAIRQMENDVRWGEVEAEEHGMIEHRTELGNEIIYDLGGKRRSFAGEITHRDHECGDFINLLQQAKSRVQPWLLIPDAGEASCMLVRLEEPRWSRTRETINHNIFPFRVKELARGLPFP